MHPLSEPTILLTDHTKLVLHLPSTWHLQSNPLSSTTAKCSICIPKRFHLQPIVWCANPFPPLFGSRLLPKIAVPRSFIPTFHRKSKNWTANPFRKIIKMANDSAEAWPAAEPRFLQRVLSAIDYRTLERNHQFVVGKDHRGNATENRCPHQVQSDRYMVASPHEIPFHRSWTHPLPRPSFTDVQVQIWSEESSDIPRSLKQALSSDKKSHRLLLKSKGYTSNIIAVCETLDDDIKDLFDDLKVYLVDDFDNRNSSNLTMEDRQRIAGFLRDASRDGVSQWVSKHRFV